MGKVFKYVILQSRYTNEKIALKKDVHENAYNQKVR